VRISISKRKKSAKLISISSLMSSVPTDKILSGISGIFQNKPSPNDWQGWDALDARYNSPVGNQAAYWTANNGDSVSNEALNVIQYLTKKQNGFNQVYEAGLGKYWMNQNDFIQKIGSKLIAGGYRNEANQIIQQYKDMLTQNQGGKENLPKTNKEEPKMKSKSNLVWYISGGVALLLIGGLTIYFVKKKNSNNG
jgi:hypothetical protein